MEVGTSPPDPMNLPKRGRLSKHLALSPAARRQPCRGHLTLWSPPCLEFYTWNLPNEYYAQIGESKFLALDRGSGFRRSFVGELVSAFAKPRGLS